MKTQSMEQGPFNPYAAPKAALADAAAPEVQPVFFPVSLPKLAFMSLATFGLYEIYAVNDINAKFAPGADGNGRFSGWNIAGLLAGGIVLALAILGTLVPE